MISGIRDMRYERLVETDNTADDNVDDGTDTDETNAPHFNSHRRFKKIVHSN